MAPTAENRDGPDKPGYRFGPVVIVPELLSGKDDPWAHRKGEPRVFVLIWAMYLMGAALLTIFAVHALGAPSAARYEYGCRAMIVLVACGLGVLWPMARLSQVPPASPVRAMLIDYFALLAPVQAVVWPMPLLTTWTLPIAAALSLMLASWGLLTGVVVAAGTGSRSVATRTGLMIVALGLVGAAPALALFVGSSGGTGLAGWWKMLSPLTAGLGLTETPGNQTAHLSGMGWAFAGGPMLLAVVLLLVLRPVIGRGNGPAKGGSACDERVWSGPGEA